MTSVILSWFVWLSSHQIGVTIVALVLIVPWFMYEYGRRKGDCQTHIWFMFSLNLIGVIAGLYVLLPTLATSLGKKPANDAPTMMACFGSFAVIVFTGQNVLKDLNTLFNEEVQPKRGKQAEKIDSDAG